MELIRKFTEPVDMTEGAPWKKIVLFAVPMLVGNIAQQLYNTVDSVVVGNYVGDNALAAVGSAGPILNLLIVLFVGISVGAGIMVSQYFGAKEREKLSVTIGNCITLTGIATLFVMVAASMVAKPLLRLLDTPDSIIDWCNSYLLILFIGSAGLAFYNILSGVLRGLGDSVSALVYLLVSTIINIVLDLLFVAKLGMGVNGVALATVIAQAVSALLCLRRLMRLTDLFDEGMLSEIKRQVCPKDYPSGPAFRYHPGYFFHGNDRGPVPYQQFWGNVHCGQCNCHACGRFCDDAELFFWYGDDDLCRPECGGKAR